MARVGGAGLSLGKSILRGSGGLFICLTAVLPGCRPGPRPAPARSRARSAAHVDPSYGKRQLSFEPNRGQADARVSFLARGGGYSLSLEPTRAVFALGTEPSTLAMRLVGASATASAVGESPLPGKVNYYLGNDPKRWHENIPTFGQVRYSNVYPGVDLVYYGTAGQLEYDFVVAPGADPGRIRVDFDGARARLDAHGDVVLARGNAEVRLRNLIVYQEKAGAREAVAGRFVLAGDHQVRFAVADYDHGRALIIDPTVVYATYLGGANNDFLYGLAVDSKGSAIAVGDTQNSLPMGFPVTSSAFQSTNPNTRDAAFITKLAPDGSSLAFSTYLGGMGGDYHGGNNGSTHALAVAVDQQDGIYVTGEAWSTEFPTTAGVFQPLIGGYAGAKQFGGGQGDAFVTKLTATGTLAYSTLLGGQEEEAASAIAVDAAGNAYVTGNTRGSQFSQHTDGTAVTTALFPTTANAYQAPFREPIDPATGSRPDQGNEPFFAKLDPTGSTLLYSTLLAPTTCVHQCSSDGSTCTDNPNSCATGNCNLYCGGQDFSVSVAIGAGGIAYIGGRTSDPHFPTTPGALQTVSHPALNALGAGGGPTGFIAAFDPTKSGAASLVYSTFLGGKKSNTSEEIKSIAADADGNVYATGITNSADFPTTPGAYATTACTDPTATHCGAVFVTKLAPTGAKLVYSTVITDGADDSYKITIDSARNAYLLSRGHNPNFRFIDPVSEMGGMSIQTLSADGSKLLFSTLFSSEADSPSGLVVDKAGYIYVGSINGNHDLAVTPGAFQTTPGVDADGNLNRDGFVVKFSPIAVAAPMPDGGVDGGGAAGGGGGVAGTSGAGGGGGTAGAGGTSGGAGGGAGAAPSDAGTPKDAGADHHPSPGGSNGCGGCGVASNDAPASSLGVMMLLVALSLRRRARRRS